MAIKKVLHIGPSLDGIGGVSTVVRDFYQLSDKINTEKYIIDFFTSRSFKRTNKRIIQVIEDLVKFIPIFNAYDIFHIHTSTGASLLRKIIYFGAGWLFNKKIICHVHSGDFIGVFKKSNALIRLIIKTLITKSDRVILVSESSKLEMISTFGNLETFVAIPNCAREFESIITSTEIVKNRNEFSYLLYCGALSKPKGLDDLLIAISILAKKSTHNLKLKIAGAGSTALWEKRCDELQIRGNVEFHGWVEGVFKRDIYDNCSIYCQPSHKEAFGISVLEALLCHKPVIGTKVGGLKDLVIDGFNGYLVPCGCPEEIADRISSLISNPGLRLEMGENSYRHAVRNFNTKEFVEKVKKLYAQVITE